MGILSWIVFGLIAGLLARWIMPGKAPGGIIITILLGIGGAIVGGFLGHFLGLGDAANFSFTSFALAVGGAVLLLVIYGLLQQRS